MSIFAHYPGPARSGVGSQELELVQARYAAMPALVWGAAMVVAVLITVAQTVPSRLATQSPAASEPCECLVYGA